LFDENVSRGHFQIQRVDQGYRLQDLGSINGTQVNGELVAETLLYHEDTIGCGVSQLQFLCPTCPSPDKTSVELAATPGPTGDELREQLLTDTSITHLLGEVDESSEIRTAAQPQKVDELMQVYRISQELAAASDAQGVYQTLLSALDHLLEHQRIVIFRYDAVSGSLLPALHRKASNDKPRTRIQVNRNLVEQCCRERACVAYDLTGEISALVGPFRGKEGVHGAVYLEVENGSRVTRQVKLLAAVCDAAGQVIERCELEIAVQQQNLKLRDFNEALERKVQERTRELTILYEISQATGYVLDFDRLATIILGGVAQVIGFDLGGLLICRGGRLEQKIHSSAEVSAETTERMEQAVRLLFQDHCEPSRESWQAIEASLSSHGLLEGFESLLYVPICCGEALPIGVIYLMSSARQVFSDGDRRFLETVCNQVSTAFEQVHHALERQASTLRSLLDGLFEGVVVADKRGVVGLCNPVGQDCLDKLCRQSNWGRIEMGADQPFAALTRELADQRVLTREFSSAEDGQRYSFALSRFSQSDQEDSFTLIFRDISDEFATRQRLQQAERLSSLGELIAGIAHELNNPLTSVMGYAQLLLMEGNETEEVQRIYEEGDRCGRIVRKLLSLGRTTENERTTLQVNALLNEAVDILEYELTVHNVKVEKHFDPELPLTFADPYQLAQAFLNLLNNAFQAITQHRKEGTITLSTRLENQELVIGVADDGPGVPAEIHSRVFDPFFTTKEVGQGTGLGLSQVHAIVEDHGGSIRLKSSPETGTRFTIRLPVREDPEAPFEAPVTSEESAGASQMRVLIADDEPTIQALISRVLDSMGHLYDTASTGVEALELAIRTEYDCLIVDFRMPGMDGPTLHQALRERRPHLAEQTIFITGDLGAPETQSYLAECGCQSLEKPFNLKRLSDAILQVAASKESSQDLP